MAEAIVSIVVHRLRDLLSDDAQAFQGVIRDQVEEVTAKLRWMQNFLQDADSRIAEYGIRVLIADIQDLAYDAEHVVESFLLKASSSKKDRRGVIGNIMKRYFSSVLHEYDRQHKFGKEIKDIQMRLSDLSNCFRDYNIRSTTEGIESSNLSHGTLGKLKRFYSHAVVEPELFVGFHTDVESLVGHLVNDCYPVIFICGMGGLGKTTLARKIYNHCIIKTHFASLAWVSISQKWQAKDVWQRILIDLVQDHQQIEEILQMDDTRLQENLIQIQQQKNCLIVLDDIWSSQAWDCLKAAFPTDKSRSKLMLTSRITNIAKHVNPECFIHQPQLLSAEQSWELLQMKALPKGDYLDTRHIKEMEELGRKMVGECGGLPLAIVVLGGILVTKPSLTEWEKVHDDAQYSLKRGTGLGEDHQREVFDILVWSYNDLPPQLKPCFLYLGKFAEDKEIEADTLYQLWIAEGFVLSSDKIKAETMMEVAESYLGELMHKSMVQVKFEEAEDSLVRKFKSCRLHDLMRDLSQLKAKTESFFKIHDLQRRFNDNHLDPSKDSSPQYRRLVIYSDGGTSSTKSIPVVVTKASQRCLRSVLHLDESGQSNLLSQKFRWHIENFRLLRVCVLEQVKISARTTVLGIHFSNNVGQILGKLVYLRYLSLRNTDMLMFPSFVQNLELLQTLKLEKKGFMNFPPWISKNILAKLGRLRHLYLPDVDRLVTTGKLGFDGLSKLEILENFNPRWCEVKDLPKLSNLRRLTINVERSYEAVEEMINYLPRIATSSCLHLSIYIMWCNLRAGNGSAIARKLLFDHRLSFHRFTLRGPIPELHPLFEQQHKISNSKDVYSRITMLSLDLSSLQEDPMRVLEKFPTLRNLQLTSGSFVGKKMVCSAMGFPNLTTLRLVLLINLEIWRVDEGSMPNLTNLGIECCDNLKELPEGLRFLPKLEELKLLHMPTAFYDRLGVVNGVPGPDYHKVSHVPSLILDQFFSNTM